MLPSSQLSIYQPLETFALSERRRWAAYIKSGARTTDGSGYRDVAFSVPGQTGVMHPVVAEHAFVRKQNGVWLVCPWRMRFRMLMGLLSFRSALPNDVADAFVPPGEAEKAIDELERLRGDVPEMRAHIVTSTWHVPIRWFVPFDDSERIVEGEGEGRVRVRYETDVATAGARLERGRSILVAASMPDGVVQAVSDLTEWVKEFPSESLLELDYGNVADLLTEEELIADRSAGEVWACLEALSTGDLAESSRRYARLAGWWGRVQALETAN